MNLRITRIKPNPAGKDKTKNGSATASQLAAEWVDIRNEGGVALNLRGVSLWHRAYTSGQSWEWEKVTDFEFSLPAGETVRVHSGRNNSISVINIEDRGGANYHAFTGTDRYVWNNREGDEPLLFVGAKKETIDRATYDPQPPEGIVLVRYGNKLIAAAQAAGW